MKYHSQAILWLDLGEEHRAFSWGFSRIISAAGSGLHSLFTHTIMFPTEMPSPMLSVAVPFFSRSWKTGGAYSIGRGHWGDLLDLGKGGHLSTNGNQLAASVNWRMTESNQT
jgi:hypothetical protein